jgi:hypothetical protein
MIKKIVVLLLVLFAFAELKAQRYKAYIDEEGVIVDSLEASHFTIFSQVADTAWRISLYSIDDTPIRVSTYSDTTFTLLHGDFVEYEKYYPSVRAEGDGEFINYIKLRGRFINGLRDGVWIEYYPTKNPLRVSTYRFGMLNGPYYEYYRRTNTLFAEGSYVNNRREGEWKFFDEEGKLLRTELYKRGRIQKKKR